MKLSYGTVQAIAAQGEQRATAFNREDDLSAVDACALDEMFSQGDPVLAGVCLASGYIFGLELEERRGGEEWAAFLQRGKEQGLNPAIVVKDAAKGIAKGVSTVFPEADQRDDCFHALYEMGKVRRRLEAKAYGAMAREMEAEGKLERLRGTGKGNRRKLVHARRRCSDAVEMHDAFERAMNDAVEAMAFVDLNSAQIRTPTQMKVAITGAAERMLALDHDECQRVGKYIRNRAPGLASYMETVGTELSALADQCGGDAVRVAAVIWRLSDDLSEQRRPWAEREMRRTLTAATSILRALTGNEVDVVLTAVDSAMQRRYRASSAIEGFNAALRPFLYVHKGVTQGFLELFRAYHNLKTRRWGRHKGTSARQCLTGQPVNDWLSTLGYHPSAPKH